ncbi:acyltransferase family protein, partial [Alistipes putredinis]
SIFLYRLSTLNYWLEHKGFWYIAMLIPLYFLTPFYARIIDKTKYQTLLTVTLCIILLLISTIKIENNNLFSHVWNNTAFVLQRIPSYLIGYYMAPSILKGKKVNLLKLTGIIAGCFLVIKIIFPANTFWEWLEIYPIMLVSYFFIKKSVWIKRICTFMGQISLESYLTNGCMILLIGLLPWETTLDHLNYGNYLRYTLIIVTGITTAYCANRIINKITARL